MCPEDVADFYPADHKDPDGMFASFRIFLCVIAYNTKLVKKDEAPKRALPSCSIRNGKTRSAARRMRATAHLTNRFFFFFFFFFTSFSYICCEAMEHTIGLLRYIKRTHMLETIVDRGEICASACIPVFLQGQRRWGALTSSWLFHEVWHWADTKRKEARVNRTLTERLFQDYYLPAGVSETWLGHLRIMVQHSDYWQTGENLWEDKSGIITDPLDNLVPRDVMQQRF